MLNSEEKNYEKTFFHSKWRPSMAWAYLIICLFDFIIGPIFWTLLQEMANVQEFVQWKPMTSSAGGLFHMAMLGIVGVTAWGRTQEKLRFNPFGDYDIERESFDTRPMRRTRQTFPDEPPPFNRMEE